MSELRPKVYMNAFALIRAAKQIEAFERETSETREQCADEFIARMAHEYKASLVSYIERCQNYIDECKAEMNRPYDQYGNDPADEAKISLRRWRAELIEATRQLELSDAELLEFIKPSPPHHLTYR